MTTTHTLTGYSITLLGLSKTTELKLQQLGISTLEQLARLALPDAQQAAREAVAAIQQELAERFAPRRVQCFGKTSFATHFVIHVEDLFFFKASCIPDDDDSYTCTYHWHTSDAQHSEFFREPTQVRSDQAISVTPTISVDSKPNRSEQTPAAMKPALHRSSSSWDSYDEWNHALATYFTAGVPQGHVVYLSVDDAIIQQIEHQLTVRLGHSPEPFIAAVRRRVVHGRRVDFRRIWGRNCYGEPNCIAFLAAMVLAASRMAEDEEESIAASNYFTRFCEVLQLNQESGRPSGMRSGAESEEPLWHEWAKWLGENGLISSARPGEGPNRYINYPISQALLRGVDRNRLYRLFRESNWADDWDIEMVTAAVRRAAPYLTKHLQRLLSDRSQRAEAIAEAIYEVYDTWARGEGDDHTSYRSRRNYLMVGIWRSEDVLSGAIEYFLYPQAPRRQRIDELIVDIDNQPRTLTIERPGWYMPICPVNEQHLNQGVRYTVIQPPELNALLLPSRTFWILRPDPNNPESGVYASWGRVPLGTKCIILCRKELLADLDQLRAERLIEWNGDPQSIPSFAEWVEVRDCMVISPVWDGVEIKHSDLHSALQPRERLNIGLSGGLRAPRGGWIAGFGPQVTIFGFASEADVRVFRLSDDKQIYEETKPTNQPFSIPWQTPGDYRIEATAEGLLCQSLVKLVDWDQLEMASDDDFEWPQIGTIRLCGAVSHLLDTEA